MEMLCKTQHATKNAATFWGLYCKVPPDLSKHLKRIFSMPNVRSITQRVCVCFLLNCISRIVAGIKYGVISHVFNGYPLSPNSHPSNGGFPSKMAGMVEFASMNESWLEPG